MSKTIKMYRYIVRSTEYLPGGDELNYYTETKWSSVTLVTDKDKAIVKIETKEVEVADSCLRRCSRE